MKEELLNKIRYELGMIRPNSQGNIIIPAMFSVTAGKPEEYLLMFRSDVLCYLPPDSEDGEPLLMETADEELLEMFLAFLRTLPSNAESLEEEREEFEELDIIEESISHVLVDTEDSSEDKTQVKDGDSGKASIGFMAQAKLSDDPKGRLVVFVNAATGKYVPLGYFDITNEESKELLKSDLLAISALLSQYGGKI